MAARAKPWIAKPWIAKPWIAKPWIAKPWIGGVIGAAAALALGGCAGVSDVGSYALVLQDRYAYSTCQEIATTRGNLTNREKDLVELIQKADSGFGGILVSITTYRSELAQVRAQLKFLARAEQEKNCSAPGKR
jgi:hypothetical protein